MSRHRRSKNVPAAPGDLGGAATARVLGAREFRGAPEAVGEARRMVSALLGTGVEAAVAHDVVLLTSELAANAVRHTASAGGVFSVVVLDVGDAFRVEVVDAGGVGHGPEVLRVPDTTTYGRGMFLVQCLARRWGTWADDAGRTTWFEIGGTVETAVADGPSPGVDRTASRGEPDGTPEWV